GPRIKRRAVGLVGAPHVDDAVDRDALPGQVAVRGNKVPKVGARLGLGSRRRGAVGGPRLCAAHRAGGCEDRGSNNAEPSNASLPCPNMEDCDVVKVAPQARLGHSRRTNSHGTKISNSSGSRATVSLKGPI